MDRMTCIADLMNEQLLADMVAQGYIRVQVHPTEPLRIYNYTEKAMFDNVWNQATLQCRGLIADTDGFIVARPWEKFFNYGQKATLIGSHDTVEITDKFDGSLGIGYPTINGYAIATRGSFMSDQAKWATRWIEGGAYWTPAVHGVTPLFEIVYPENRIVLDYGSFEGLVLLGAVDTDMGHVYGPLEAAGMLDWRWSTTKVFPYRTMAEFVSSPDAARPNAEGVVVRSGHRMVKIKQEDYIAAHSVVTNVSNRAVWEMLVAGNGSIAAQASFMPDEFYIWIVKTATEIYNAKVLWENTARAEFERTAYKQYKNEKKDRRSFAETACKSPYSAALFKLYDNQSISDLAWKAVKPTVFERPFSRSEANS